MKTSDGNFADLAYFGARTIVTCEQHTYPARVRLWDLTRDAAPTELTQEQAVVAELVLRPGGAEFLHRKGAWTEGELPDPVKAEAVLRLVKTDALRGLPSQGVGSVVAFAPDGEHLLLKKSGVIDGQERINFYLRDPAGGIHALYIGDAMVWASGGFSPSGHRAAMTCGSKRVGVWDTSERREVVAFEANDKVTRLAFVSEDRLVVIGGRSVGLWDATTGRLLKKSRAFRLRGDALAVSPDRTRYLAGSHDGGVRIWDATARELKDYDWKIGAVLAAAFSPDGTTAAACGFKSFAVWDVD